MFHILLINFNLISETSSNISISDFKKFLKNINNSLCIKIFSCLYIIGRGPLYVFIVVVGSCHLKSTKTPVVQSILAEHAPAYGLTLCSCSHS